MALDESFGNCLTLIRGSGGHGGEWLVCALKYMFITSSWRRYCSLVTTHTSLFGNEYYCFFSLMNISHKKNDKL